MKRRGGRPRKSGPRKPSGDLIRVAEDPMAVVIAQRRKVAVMAGITLAPTPVSAKERTKANKADRIVLLDQRIECSLGRAAMKGLINDREYRAGIIFGQRYSRMARIMGWPSPHVKAIDLGAAHGLALKGEIDEDEIKTVKESYYEVERWLLDMKNGALASIHSLVILDHELTRHTHNMSVTKVRLAALADKLGLGK